MQLLVVEMVADVLVGFLGDEEMVEILGEDLGDSALNGKMTVDIEVLNPRRLVMAES